MTFYVDVEHFRERVVQDALAEATADYWERRADAFNAARPRPGDFAGQSSEAGMTEARTRLAALALACRRRAAVERARTEAG